MSETHFDLIVIGSGPGGYVAAIRAAQLGMKVACVEKRSTLGGTCLNIGCIPSKALLHASYKFQERQKGAEMGIVSKETQVDLPQMMRWKEKIVEDLTKGITFLFEKNKITLLQGRGTFTSPKELQIEKRLYTAEKFLIATGSEPSAIAGIEIDEKAILSSTGVLSLKTVPKRLVVIGGGYIGLEMASVWSRLGTQTTIVEFMDRIVPAMDQELGKALFKALKAQGIEFKLSTQIQGAEKLKKELILSLKGQKTEEMECDALLVCAGRRPYTRNLGLEAVGLKTDERGCLEVNENYQTELPYIYAIGDVISGPMLAHKAEEEGVVCVERMVGQKSHVNYQAIPAIIYTHPEAASVGFTEEELQKSNRPYKVGKFPFSANSRARATGDTEGFVKILSDAETDEVYGVHILHSEAGTLISEATLAMEYRASSEDIARTCHAHPTLNETVKEAALNALGRSIHI